MGDKPMIDVMVHDGLYCSIADEGMGAMSDAENARLGVTREAQDELAARSHANAAAGRERLAEEIVAAARARRTTRACARRAWRRWPRSRRRSRANGTITAGNASQVSDGAAAAVVTTARPRAPSRSPRSSAAP